MRCDIDKIIYLTYNRDNKVRDIYTICLYLAIVYILYFHH